MSGDQLFRLSTVCCLVLISACAAAPTCAAQSSSGLTREVIEIQHALTPVDLVLQGNRIYVLDRKDMRVSVYSRDGRRLRFFGRPGEGPGEFRRPKSLDVRGKLVAVTERSGRTSVFDTTGAFLRSFHTPGIMHLNSGMRLLNDSLIFVGGLREEAGDGLYEGMMGHIYTINGGRKHDFMPLTENARLYETAVIVGASCDDDGQTLWCTQPLDYKIRRYDFFGNELGSFTVEPEYYRPLNKKQPRDLRSTEMGRWLDSWDSPTHVYSLNDSLLVSNVLVGGPGGDKIDVIHKGSGKVLATHEFEGGLAYVDSEDQLLVFQRPTPPEPVTVYELVPAARLWE